MRMCDLDAQRRRQTLDQLEGIVWEPPTYDSSMVVTCHRLRTKPIGEFSAGDLRLMISQQMGLMFLVPLALEVLEREPLVEATFFPGDLLCGVLRVPAEFWRRHADLRSRMDAVIDKLSDTPDPVANEVEAYGRTIARGAE